MCTNVEESTDTCVATEFEVNRVITGLNSSGAYDAQCTNLEKIGEKIKTLKNTGFRRLGIEFLTPKMV